MASRYFPKTVPLSLPAQIARMRDLYPALCRVSWERGLLQWEGSLQPMDASHEYRIKITYRLRRAPRVRVLTPELKVNSKGEAIPHRYRDGNLCLYYPGYGEWNSAMAIAETIVPWTSLWLYHYEIWHAIGDWLGGGIDHAGPKVAAT
jgi:hypothetical protein